MSNKTMNNILDNIPSDSKVFRLNKKKLQKYLLYLYFFSIHFELWDPFNIGIDFLITKVTVMLYLTATLLNYKSFYSIKEIKKYIYPIFGFFFLLTIMNIKNRTLGYGTFFDIPLFLNLLILLTAINHEKREPQILLKSLFVFSSGTILLTIMYFLNIGTSYALEGRISILGANANELGIRLSISMLILFSIIYENKFKFGKSRYLFYVFVPLMFMFLVKTGSRVAFISLFLGIITLILLYKSHINIKKIFSVLSLIIILFAIWEFYLKNSFLAERLSSSINKGDLSQRDVLWIAAISFIPQNFIFGQGETGYAHSITMLFGSYASPHNVIIEILCYTGIVGLIFFTIFLKRTLSCGIRSYKEDKEVLPIILFIPILGMIFSGQIFGDKIAWIILAYMIGLSVQKHLNTDLEEEII